jgi:hypothetical protein
MKKFILTFAIGAMATIGANAQISFGFQAGTNLATYKAEDNSSNPNTTYKGKTKAGFTAGVVANIPFSSMISLRPELNYIQKGGKNTSSGSNGGSSYKDESTATMNFIELPVNVVLNFPVGAGRFSVGAGPNFSFGLSGKNKYTNSVTFGGTTQTSTGKNDVKFDGKKYADLPVTDVDAHFKAFDMGANAFVGYKLNMGVFFNAGYTIGLSNLDPNDKQSFKTAGLTLKVGYMFGGNKGSKKED